ncbi:PO113 protein, partial [Calyptomena viridis]|nr:PO113 protein [Calyptomena viridis]
TKHDWLYKTKISLTPIKDAFTVFTDAGKASRRAAIVWLSEDTEWQHKILEGTEQDSLQTLELKAVIGALLKWAHIPLNIVTDSLYVTGVVQQIEDASIRDIQNKHLGQLFQ